MAKMQKSNVQGNICKVINCMYQNIKTCIRKGNEYSEFFICEIGVKQGENCSFFCSRCIYKMIWKFSLAKIR